MPRPSNVVLAAAIALMCPGLEVVVVAAVAMVVVVVVVGLVEGLVPSLTCVYRV